MVKLQELSKNELFGPGHRLCAGCGPAISMRMLTKAFRGPTVVTNATGCVEVATTIYPFNAWQVPYVHSAFENVAATASGIEAGYKALRRRGALKEHIDVIAIGGDGGTFDIGIQALSGALERGHDFVYLCYDNEAYMNTGIQRSGATPRGAATTTSPAGSKIPGKPEWKKDFAGICIAHGIPYVATATIGYWNDYITKVRKAIEVEGPAVVHVLAPCPLGWRFEPKLTMKLSRLAVQTRYFPIYEYDRGKYILSIKVPNPLPVEEFLKHQGRFRHLFKPELKPEIEKIQAGVNLNYERIAKICDEH
ncbi:MAG: thiamine pyrophosphate-dependent enzyme [Candidatus Bathyarchaeia archaeon]